jgi:OmcA/MtrC family decaheme c-type cytochrome
MLKLSLVKSLYIVYVKRGFMHGVNQKVTIMGLAGALSLGAIILAACATNNGATNNPTGTTSTAPGGLKASISKVSIGADLLPVVNIKITDNAGNPVDVAKLDSGMARFTIAGIKVDSSSGQSEWVNYVTVDSKGAPFKFYTETRQPAIPLVKGVPSGGMDVKGTWKQTTPGNYTYTFQNAVPATFDKNATTRVFFQATSENRTYAANAIYDFVPGGATPSVERNIVSTQACNQCHGILAVHGTARRDTKSCVTCHTPQNIDPASGNSLDFKVLIHKVHDGANLPSVKAGTAYFIGNSAHDFSGVKWPQDVRNCTYCHQGAAQSDHWKTSPNRAACGSCHDEVNFATGKNHPGGPQTNDSACAACHSPDAITKVHTPPVH